MAVKPLIEQGINVEDIIRKYENTTAWGRVITRCASRDIKPRSHFEDKLIEKDTVTDEDALLLEEVCNLVYNYEEAEE